MPKAAVTKTPRYYRNGHLEMVRKNRQPDQVAEFEKALEGYCTTMRKLFKEGSTDPSAVRNDLRVHVHYWKQDKANRKMEAFGEQQSKAAVVRRIERGIAARIAKRRTA